MDQRTESCAAKLALSIEEEIVLRRMRKIRKEYFLIQEELRELTSPQDIALRERLERKIEDLRQQFRACREDLKQANQKKMKRLGYNP